MSIYLQPLDHGNDLHQGKLFLTGVIVSRGSFILLRCARTVLVTELIRGMDQLPRVLEDTINSSELKKDKRQNPLTSRLDPHRSTTAQALLPSPTSTYNFHDVRAPLGQQLQAPEREVEQLSVLLIRLLAVQAGARHHFAVAVARQLRDESDVVLPDLHHLLAQVVLRRDAALSARPPAQKKEVMSQWSGAAGFPQAISVSNAFKQLLLLGLVFFIVSACLNVTGQLYLHVSKQGHHLKLRRKDRSRACYAHKYNPG